MTSPYELPHLDLSRRVQAVPFTSAGLNPVGAGTPRSREQHGAKLRGELAAAYRAFDAARREDERIGPPEGAFLEVELKRGTRIEAVERKKDGIMPGAARRDDIDIRIVGLYVPDEAREVFLDILREYQEGELTPKGNPRRKGFVEAIESIRQARLEAIESIRQARLETFWTDDVSRLPPPGREMWWEIWCLRRLEDDLDALVERLGARAAERERRLYFPEHVVLPVLADRATIELMLFARLSIVELRRARSVFAPRHGRRHQPLYADFDAVDPGQVPIQARYRHGSGQSRRLSVEDRRLRCRFAGPAFDRTEHRPSSTRFVPCYQRRHRPGSASCGTAGGQVPRLLARDHTRPHHPRRGLDSSHDQLPV